MNAEEVQKQVQELESLRSQTRKWRTGSVLAIIAIVGFCVWRMIDGVAGLAQAGPRQDAFLGDVTSSLKKDVLPSVQKTATQAFYDIKPAVEREIQKLNDRAPDIAAALKKEVEILTHNLPNHGQKILDSTFGAMIKKREDKIRKMYPGVTEEKVATLVHNLVAEAHDQIEHVGDKLFAEHVLSLNNILDYVATIQKTEKVEDGAEFPKWEMASLIIDMLHQEFKDLGSEEEPTTGPAATPRKKKEPKKSDAKKSETK
jgi:hypothetical protein